MNYKKALKKCRKENMYSTTKSRLNQKFSRETALYSNPPKPIDLYDIWWRTRENSVYSDIHCNITQNVSRSIWYTLR